MLRAMAGIPTPPFRLCLLLTRELCANDPLTVLREAVAGGVDCVQLREKDMSTSERHAWGTELLEHCAKLRVPLIINDDIEVAAAIGARGVHLGQDDFPVHEARKLLRPGQWLGLSTHSVEQLDEAGDLGVDYAGFGPIHATSTKGYRTGLGAEALLGAMIYARVPVIAIGGIRPSNCMELPSHAGLAVSSVICTADDPRAVAQALVTRGDSSLLGY